MDNIKKWYMSEFVTDELGQEINPKATFEGLTKSIPNVYYYLKVSDSIIRERVFEELAERAKVGYDYVYNKWLEQ